MNRAPTLRPFGYGFAGLWLLAIDFVDKTALV
jgi:hypothetical protein